MKQTLLGLTLLSAFVANLAVASTDPLQLGAPPVGTALNAQSMAKARDAVLPHVVSILVVREDFGNGEARLSMTSGTGTIVTQNGYVATNAHVTENGKRFRVVMNDRREFPAMLVGTDAMSDLAVLKILAPGIKFGFAEFASDITDLKPGDTVLAMGAPWGMKDSVSAGVVNNNNRLLISLFEDEADYEQSLNALQSTARYYAWIQHDASISPGNSGGPLVDLNGRIVGVNTRGGGFGGDMAFSIPGPIAAQVVGTLIQQGRVIRSDFGFGVRSLRGTGLSEGAMVSQVNRTSGAGKAGLKPGDRLMAIDDVPITLAEPEDIPRFRRSLAERMIGSTLKLSVLRDAKLLNMRVKSTEQSDGKPDELEVPHWGVSVSNINREIAKVLQLDEEAGVLVRSLRTGGPAATAQPSMQAGDRIVAVNGKSVASVEALTAIIGKELNDKSVGDMTVSLDRKGQSILALLTPAPKRIIPPTNPELSKFWAGWELQPVPVTLAGAFGLSEGGFRVTQIYAKSPAAKAGMKTGDLIVATGGIPVKPSGLKETGALDLRVRNAEDASAFVVSAIRNGKKAEYALKLVEQPLPVEKAEQRWNATLSVTLRSLTFFDRVERKLGDEQNGVLIERVENGGFAGLAHLREGDLLVNLNGTAVTDLDHFESALADVKTRGAARLSFLVMRGTDTRLLFVDSPWNEVSK